MMLVERLLPGRGFPRVEGWLVRAISINGCQVLAILLAGVGWNGWMAQHRAWSADHLGMVAGALAGYVVLTFVYYWWHLYLAIGLGPKAAAGAMTLSGIGELFYHW